MSEVPDIRKNYIDVLNSVNKITEECGRKQGSVRLIAVSKTKPAEYIKEAVEAGLIDEVGGIKEALHKLYQMIDAKN